MGHTLFAQTYTLFPANNDTEINPDTRLILTFEDPVVLGNSGTIRIYDAATDMAVDSLDMSIPPGPLNNRTPSPYDTITYPNIPNTMYTVSNPDTNSSHVYQINYIGGTTDADIYHFYPVLIRDNEAIICLHNNHLEYNKTYYVLIDAAVFSLEDASFTGITEKIDWVFSTKSTPPSADSATYIVTADGSGDFSTVQGAIDFIPDENPVQKTIFIKSGIYEEIIFFREKENLTILGEDRDKVEIQYANNGVFNYKNISPEPGISLHNIRAVFAMNNSTDIKLINFTVHSLGEPPAQAEGLLTKGDRIQVHNVTILGSGDALQATGIIYMSQTSLEGFGDNVLGYGAVFFNRCELISTYGPHLWVRNTDENHGNVFVASKFRTIGDVETDIARAPTNHGIDYPFAEAVLLNCELEGVRSGGWGSVGPETENLHYWEYNSINLDDWSPVDVSLRASYSRQLAMPEDSAIIANYSNPTWVLDGWTPEQAPMILPQPDTMTATRGSIAEIYVRAAVAPRADYQWYKDGIKLPDQTNPTIRIPSVNIDDEGKYSVSIKNYLGYDSSYVVTFVTEEPPTSAVAKKNMNTSAIKVYPNPAKNILNLEYENDLPGTLYGSVIDLRGSKVLAFQETSVVGHNLKVIDVASLKTGMYVLFIHNTACNMQYKLCINK